MDRDDHLVMLGEIKGKLDQIDSTVSSIDDRLRQVELKGAASGGAAGAVSAIITSIIVAYLQAPPGSRGGS